MQNTATYMSAGAAIGFIVGVSMGVAVGGAAYNAAIFFVPLGAFIGWLIASRVPPSVKKSDATEIEQAASTPSQSSETEVVLREGIGMIVHSALAIMAFAWNFHIEVLRLLGVLPTFVRQPLLFAGLCIVISVVFPPFIGIYFIAWLAANHFGLSQENQYRAIIK